MKIPSQGLTHLFSPPSKIGSLDHLIRPLEHVDGNCQSDLFGRLKINDNSNLVACCTGKSAVRFAALQTISLSCVMNLTRLFAQTTNELRIWQINNEITSVPTLIE